MGSSRIISPAGQNIDGSLSISNSQGALTIAAKQTNLLLNTTELAGTKSAQMFCSDD